MIVLFDKEKHLSKIQQVLYRDSEGSKAITTPGIYNITQESTTRSPYFIYEDGDKFAGLAIVNGSNEPYQYGRIAKFYVAPEYRGKGVAGKLMHRIRTHCMSLGYEHLYLGVYVWNKQAIGFYRKHMFVDSGRQEGVNENGPILYMKHVLKY